MKNILSALLLATVLTAFSQKIPVISSISPTFGNVGETLTIVGSGFPTTAANVQVKIGSGIAQVTSIQESLIEVTIPANATFGPVQITNLTTNLIGVSSEDFKLSFGGGTFDDSRVGALSNISTGQFFIWELCDCDFDSDGKTDVAISARENSSSGAKAKRVIYRNTSTIGTIQFSEAASVGLKPSRPINCADFDGDGKPELIAGQINGDNDSGTENIEIYHNGSSSGNISFPSSPSIELVIPRNQDNEIRRAARILNSDLDQDGKLDFIVSNDNDGTLLIYKNISTVGNLEFEDPIEIVVPAGASDAINLSYSYGDLNNDNLPDLVVALFDNREFFIFENVSTGNGIEFDDFIRISPTQQYDIRDIEIADLNNDGFNDIVASDINPTGTESRMLFISNETTTNGQDITLGNIEEVNVSKNIFDITPADVNGDGKIDLVGAVLSIDSPGLSIIINSSSSGSVSFSESKIFTSEAARFVSVVDLNGDAKPDFISTENSIVGQNEGILTTIKNNNCILPAISETSGIYCPGNTFLVEARNAINVTYQWEVSQDGGANFTTAKQNTDNFLDLSTYNTALQVKVTLIGSDGCSIESSVGSFTLNNNTPSNPSIAATSEFCVGDAITLTSPTTADEYFWSGPNGFSVETTSASVDVTTSAEPVNAGTYRLRVKNTDGCLSQEVTQTVVISSPPKPTITIDGGSDFCADANKALSTTAFPGFSIQWNLDGNPITGATNDDFLATQDGVYSVTLTDDTNDCTNTSLTSTLTAVEVPQSEITSDAQICVDVPLDIVGNSTSFDANYTLTYAWSITDANNTEVSSSNTLATTVTFNEIGTYNAALTTSYGELTGCSSITNQTIEVLGPPDFTITPEGNSTEKCPSDSILLEVPTGFDSYTWSNGGTNSSTYASTDDNESSVTLTVEANSTIGCTVTDEITISNFANSGFTVSSPTEGTEITDSLIIMPDGELRVTLEANGGTNFTWMPEDIFDSPNATSVTVVPKSPSTDIILSGTDNNGCNESESFILENNSVVARKSFSPDGNNLGFDCWEILNSRELAGCTVYVFDKRGRNIFVGDSPFENDCVWDGNITNGAQAPEGVYYFVLKCNDDNSKQYEQSGSITLARDN